MGEELNLISININGLNSAKKKILGKLCKEKTDIISLQEIHIQKSDEKYLEYPKLGKLFTSPADKKKKKGIAVYIREEIKTKLVFVDPNGRILMLEIWLPHKKVLFAFIYAPNEKQQEFYKNLHEKIVEFEQKNVLLVILM
uniref:Endonuclease/exonuclease/phosphatase domain-containing protein n=1 Tax=Micrurus surinamensis TaxID=129470 RepID=A0A2D4PX86_MICSU